LLLKWAFPYRNQLALKAVAKYRFFKFGRLSLKFRVSKVAGCCFALPTLTGTAHLLLFEQAPAA
jgi:hypothetical protein